MARKSVPSSRITVGFDEIESVSNRRRAVAWPDETDGGRRHPLDVVLRRDLQPLLEPLGFERRGRTWNRRLGPVVHVIGLQGSRYNVLTGGGLYVFQVTVGVCLTELLEIMDQEPVPDFVRDYRTHLRGTLNRLLASKQHFDGFWPERSLAEQGAALARAFAAHVLPELEQLRTLASLDRAFRGTHGAHRRKVFCVDAYQADVLAYLAARAGDSKRAERFLSEVRGVLRSKGAHARKLARLEQHLASAGEPARTATRGVATEATPPQTAAPRLITQEYPSPWLLCFCDCARLARTAEVETSFPALARAMTELDFEQLGVGGEMPRPSFGRHYQDEIWLRNRAGRRKLSRTRMMERWDSRWEPVEARGQIAELTIRRYGRDNWHVDLHVDLTKHKAHGFTLDEYVAPWTARLERIADALRPLLEPALTVLLASKSYWDLVEDLEQGALVVGFRTWYGQPLVERHGWDFLLNLPDRTTELADGSLAQRLEVPPWEMVLPKPGRYAALRRYLAGKPVRLGYPRL